MYMRDTSHMYAQIYTIMTILQNRQQIDYMCFVLEYFLTSDQLPLILITRIIYKYTSTWYLEDKVSQDYLTGGYG